MKKYQKLLAGVLAASMMAAMAGCGSGGASTPASSGSPAASTGGASTSAAANTTAPTAGDPVYGGNLTCYYSSDIDAYFDPAIGDTVIFNQFLEGLWSYDTSSGFAAVSDNMPSKALKGQLAKEWTVDEAAATLTVTLRDDVHFQKLDDQYDYYGGRQLVANDVKWTYDRLCGLGSGYDTPLETESNWAGLLKMLVSVDAPDDRPSCSTDLRRRGHRGEFHDSVHQIGGPEWDT